MGIFSRIFGKDNGPEARAFVMPVGETFSITSRGVLAIGKVQAGVLEDGDTVYFKSSQGKSRSVRVKVEISQEDHPGQTKAVAGMCVGLFLEGIGADEVTGGTIITGMQQ